LSGNSQLLSLIFLQILIEDNKKKSPNTSIFCVILRSSKGYQKLHPQGGGVFGHGEQGRQCGLGVSPSGATAVMGHGEEVTNARSLSPRRLGRQSSTDTWGWSFPSLSIKKNNS
jgi:hypothetical protein